MISNKFQLYDRRQKRTQSSKKKTNLELVDEVRVFASR